jgi:hypothetical protein
MDEKFQAVKEPPAEVGPRRDFVAERQPDREAFPEFR